MWWATVRSEIESACGSQSSRRSVLDLANDGPCVVRQFETDMDQMVAAGVAQLCFPCAPPKPSSMPRPPDAQPLPHPLM